MLFKVFYVAHVLWGTLLTEELVCEELEYEPSNLILGGHTTFPILLQALLHLFFLSGKWWNSTVQSINAGFMKQLLSIWRGNKNVRPQFMTQSLQVCFQKVPLPFCISECEAVPITLSGQVCGIHTFLFFNLGNM